MKLHKLQIHNLASIEDAVIDFDAEPLAGSDVFLISGNTGSGKSTILDAICLALYGRTPRLTHFPAQNTSKGGSETPFEERVKDARQLMRRGAGEASVTLVFETGAGEMYTAVWAVHRSGKKAGGNMQDDRRSLTVGFGDTERIFRNKKEIEAEVDRAIGLDFEQFCRTTLLAQGEFTRFLISKDEDKSQILEKITGTEVYSELGQRVYQETTRHRQEYESMNREVNSVVLLEAERIAELEKALADGEAERNRLVGDMTAIETRLQWLQNEAQLAAKYGEETERLAAARAATATEAFVEESRMVEEWNATAEARDALIHRNKADSERGQQQLLLAGLRQSFAGIKAAYSLRQSQLKRLADEIATCDEWLAGVEPRRAVYANEQTVVELLRVYWSGNQKIVKETAAIAGTRRRLDGELKERGQKLLERQRNAEQAQTAAQAALAEAAAMKAQSEARLAAKEAELAAANTLRDTKEAIYKGIKESVGDWAKALRADLKEGDTCPVCGQSVGSHLPQEEELEMLFGKAKGELDAAAASVKTIAEELNTMRKTASDAEVAMWKRLDKCREEVAACAAERQTLDAEIAKCNEAIHTAEGLIASKKDEVATAATKVHELVGDTQWQHDWRTDSAAFVAELRAEVTNYNANVDKRARLLQSQAQEQQLLHIIGEGIADIERQPSMSDQIDDASAAVFSGDLRRAVADIAGKVGVAMGALAKAESDYAVYGQRLADYLSLPGSVDIKRLEQLSMLRADEVQRRAGRVRMQLEAVAAAKGRLDAVAAQLAAHREAKPPMEEGVSIATLVERRSEAEEALRGIDQRQGAMRQQIDDDARNRRELSAKIAHRDTMLAVYRKWDRLCNLIGDQTGKKFRNIAQSYVLANLIHSANAYMETLSGRYTLHVIPETFIITVNDTWGDGHARPVSTLSGGETFLTSLALALALSDIGSHLAVDTLFIDEGFGTLSGEPLQNAVATLRSLHSQTGRHVGIISHVEELRERIPVQIRVLQDGVNSASRIEIVGQPGNDYKIH